MRLHCFVCASPLFPEDQERDRTLHEAYVRMQLDSLPDTGVALTVIQNGCQFDTGEAQSIRNPIAKNVAYNWLLCDANCRGEYWLFLPEDCRVKPRGWTEIQKRMDEGVPCFALSKDPKGFVCRRGIFDHVPHEVHTLCDMNFLGKEIACVLLRGELDKHDFHCITANWKPISEDRRQWGNELYEAINVPDHPEVNLTRRLPILQDFGLDGWKAPPHVIEEVFMKIVSGSLEEQGREAEKLKTLVARYGPLITEVPYKGLLARIRSGLAWKPRAH